MFKNIKEKFISWKFYDRNKFQNDNRNLNKKQDKVMFVFINYETISDPSRPLNGPI